MNDHRSLDPDSIPVSTARAIPLVERYDTGVALLVAAWTAAFLLRSRLAQSDWWSEIANEALLSLLFVVPIMLAGWGAAVIVDRRFKLGLFRDRGRR